MKILFIGATGMLGQPVAHELIRQGFDLSLLVRDETRAQSLFPVTQLTRGNVFDENTLLAAMQGMDTVYCNLSVEQNSKEKQPQAEREGISHIISAAKQAGIRRIVYLSSLVHKYEGMNGFHWWAFRIKEQAVQKIKASGIPYTVFYPSTFMECYPYQMLRRTTVPLLGNAKAPMWFIAAADYARQVAASLRLLTTESREYNVQGHDSYNMEQGAKIFAEHYRKAKLKTVKAPIGMMKALDWISPKFSYAWHICEALNNYPEKFESRNTWKELGEPEIRLAEYAASL